MTELSRRRIREKLGSGVGAFSSSLSTLPSISGGRKGGKKEGVEGGGAQPQTTEQGTIETQHIPARNYPSHHRTPSTPLILKLEYLCHPGWLRPPGCRRPRHAASAPPQGSASPVARWPATTAPCADGARQSSPGRQPRPAPRPQPSWSASAQAGRPQESRSIPTTAATTQTPIQSRPPYFARSHSSSVFARPVRLRKPLPRASVVTNVKACAYFNAGKEAAGIGSKSSESLAAIDHLLTRLPPPHAFPCFGFALAPRSLPKPGGRQTLAASK